MGTPRFTPVVVWLVAATSSASTIWNGPVISFTKAPGTDSSLPTNQDRITDNVWITRDSTGGGIYNTKIETAFDKPPIVLNSISPAGTEWAFGTTDDIGSLSFDTWVRTVGQSPPSSVGQPMVLHLIDDDIFLDLTFTEWGRFGSGSFSYRRSTAVIPEPSSLLLIAALASAGIVVRYRATRALNVG